MERKIALQIRLTEAEYAELKAKCTTNTLAKYIRSKLFALQNETNALQSKPNVIQIKGLSRGGVPVVLQSPEDEPLEYRTDIECMKCGNDNARKRKDRGNLCDTYFNG